MRAIGLLLVSFTILAGFAPRADAKPCECKDIEAMTKEIQRVTVAEAAWKEIFAWARGLLNGVAEPESNEELNTKFLQLARAQRSEWDRVMHTPIDAVEKPQTAGGLDANGDPIVNPEFTQKNCDDIVEGVRVHERAHRDFYLSPGNVLEAGMTSRLPRLRAESEVVSYRAQKAFLETKLDELKKRCKYRVTAISRWRVNGPANLNVVAEIQDVGMTNVGGDRYQGTGSVTWSIAADRVGDCTAKVTASASSAELNGRVDENEQFTLSVVYQPSNVSFADTCVNPEATTGGNMTVQVTADPITLSVPASGGAQRLSQALGGPESTDGYVVVSIRRGDAQPVPVAAKRRDSMEVASAPHR